MHGSLAMKNENHQYRPKKALWVKGKITKLWVKNLLGNFYPKLVLVAITFESETLESQSLILA